MQLVSAGLIAGELQQLHHHSVHMPGFLHNNAAVFRGLLRLLRNAELEAFRIALNDGNRRFELVGYVGDEFLSNLLRATLLFNIRVEPPVFCCKSLSVASSESERTLMLRASSESSSFPLAVHLREKSICAMPRVTWFIAISGLVNLFAYQAAKMMALNMIITVIAPNRLFANSALDSITFFGRILQWFAHSPLGGRI